MAGPSDVWDAVERLLENVRAIAVLGAHVREHKPAFFVPDYMHSQGYRVLPVNPTLVTETRWGEAFRARLTEIEERVDVVNVFRRSASVPNHVEELLAMNPRPRGVFMQLGVRHDGAAAQLERAGITVIQDRCLMTDHQRWSATR